MINAAGEDGVLLSPQELRDLREKGACELVDVREAVEFAGKRVPGARHLALGRIEESCGSLPRDRQLVLMCRSGRRSAQAAERLGNHGFGSILQLRGGLEAWEAAGLETEGDPGAPWPLERQVRLAAGALVLAGLGLSLVWPPAIGLSWFVGAGLVFAGLTDWCGMGLLLARAPWNRVAVAAPGTPAVACGAGADGAPEGGA
jgi:rhodanese-related sulfurtransferase